MAIYPRWCQTRQRRVEFDRPQITIVIGNSFGAGNYALCGKAYDPNFILAWPNSKYAVMGADQAAGVLAQLKKEEDVSEVHRSYLEKTDIRHGAARGWIDAIIPPHKTRDILMDLLVLKSAANYTSLPYGSAANMKIGNAGGFWGDDLEAPYRLAKAVRDLDYLTLDYLAELSLSIMESQRHKNPELGYAADFLEVIDSLLYGMRVATLKSSPTPVALIRKGLKKKSQVTLKHKNVLAVTGDNVLERLKADPHQATFNHLEKKPLSEVVQRLCSANAYLGAAGIAALTCKGPISS